MSNGQQIGLEGSCEQAVFIVPRHLWCSLSILGAQETACRGPGDVEGALYPGGNASRFLRFVASVSSCQSSKAFVLRMYSLQIRRGE